MHAPLVCTCSHSPASHAGLVVLFFQFAACYAHLPSVTVRDENAGRAQRTEHSLQTKPSDSPQTNGGRRGMMATPGIDVCRQSETNTVHTDTRRKLQPHLETKRLKKRRSRNACKLLSAVQCCSTGNACKSQPRQARHLRQLKRLTDRQLPHRIAARYCESPEWHDSLASAHNSASMLHTFGKSRMSGASGETAAAESCLLRMQY
jgi:hypothetical protein